MHEHAASPGREPANAGAKKYLHAIMLLVCLTLAAAAYSSVNCSAARTTTPSRFSNKEETMKYLVPPIVIPALLFVGIVTYGMLGPPIIGGHPPMSASSQTR